MRSAKVQIAVFESISQKLYLNSKKPHPTLAYKKHFPLVERKCLLAARSLQALLQSPKQRIHKSKVGRFFERLEGTNYKSLVILHSVQFFVKSLPSHSNCEKTLGF